MTETFQVAAVQSVETLSLPLESTDYAAADEIFRELVIRIFVITAGGLVVAGYQPVSTGLSHHQIPTGLLLYLSLPALLITAAIIGPTVMRLRRLQTDVSGGQKCRLRSRVRTVVSEEKWDADVWVSGLRLNITKRQRDLWNVASHLHSDSEATVDFLPTSRFLVTLEQ